MENCSSKISIHHGMGTTHNARSLHALQSDYFLLDEREEIDYVIIAQKLSHYLKFFNESNTEEADWSAFFAWESSAILAQIFSWKIEDEEKKYKNILKSITLINDYSEQKKRLKELFENIQQYFSLLNSKIATLDDSISVKEFLLSSEKNINSQLSAVILRISSEVSVIPLIQDYQFAKNIQQLFGLIIYWKNTTEKAFKDLLENYPSHSPHYALFLAFLKLLGIAKNDLNKFTQRHLDFYYKDILKLIPQEAEPDFVHLVIEPFAQVNSFLLPKNSVFTAGKNSAGQNKFYASTADLAVNAVKIKSFLSHFTDQNSWKKTDLFPLNGIDRPFSAFPSSAQNAKVGLLLASPLFYLKGGLRTVSLKFDTQITDPHLYEFWLTGEKKWIEILPENKMTLTDNTVQLIIPVSEKAIVPFNNKIHDGEDIASAHPVLKIIPKNNTNKIECKSLKIDINVSGLKNLLVATDTGIVDINKPFKPFGDFPKNGNGFIIGCNEFFMKKGATADFSIETDAKSSYLYTDFAASDITEIQSFTTGKLSVFQADSVAISAVTDKLAVQEFSTSFYNQSSLIDQSLLFEMRNGRFINEGNTVFGSSYTNHYPVEEYAEDEIPGKESVSGFIRIQLNDSQYAKEKFLEQYIKAAQKNTTLPEIPVIKSLIMNYSVSQHYTFTDSDRYLVPLDYYHLLPFGHLRLHPESSLSITSDWPHNGEIFIGLENAQSGNGLSILFQMAEGTANPRKDPAQIVWHYLDQNEWKLINPHDLGDETMGLLQSGIIQFTVPSFSDTATTILPNGLFWIKISVDGLDQICGFLGIYEQALKAVLYDFENTKTGFLEVTPKETVAKMYQPNSSVKKIRQPYASFGGKQKENDTQLYQRSSERLRHKQRAITSWDYERLILQEFPEVYRIKCLNHYRYDTVNISNVAAGYVTLIPVAKSLNVSAAWEWKPLLSLSTMQKLKNRMAELSSPHIRLCVKPPVLEKIKISFKVKYRDIQGAETRLYTDILKEKINKYVSPWAYSDVEIDFAKKIELSSLIQLVDSQYFVDYITDFKVTQIIIDDNGTDVLRILSDVKEIVPQTDYTLFIPHNVHEIVELKNKC